MFDHSRLSISEQKIDIWLTFYPDIVNLALLANMRALLSDTERLQEQRFHFAHDRQRYLVTRAMVRTVLSRYSAIAPAEWMFCKNAYGKPEIANLAEVSPGLCFNISHTQGLIALAVSRHRTLGVDVEHFMARTVSDGIADRFFSPAEVAELAMIPQTQRQERFFEYWTFKEAYIKARGMGLSIPLDQFGFHFPHDSAVRMSVDPKLGDDASRWFFWQTRPTREHLLAVCAERSTDNASALTFRKVIPLVGDEIFETKLLKTSY